MKPISERSPQEIHQELQEEFAGDVAAMAENYARTVPEMEELLEKGGLTYRKVRPTGEEGVINASFDVFFCPMVNVKIMVKDPHNLTEKEEEAIIEMAISEIRKNFSEKISGENVDSVKLYSIEDIEVN